MFRSCSLHVSIVGFFTIRKKRIRGGSTYVECNSGSLKEHQCYWRDPAIVSLSHLTRRNTIDSVHLPKHHTRCTLNWTAEAGRQTGRGRHGGRHGRIEAAWRMGRKEGGREGRVGREGATGGREEAMM